MEELNRPNETQTSGRRYVIAVYEIFSVVVIALIVLVLVIAYLFRVVGVSGPSMKPTLHDGDRLLLVNYISEFERGDIVVIDRYTDVPLIKRVVAVGGDTINIVRTSTGHRVLVNGQIQYEPYIQGDTVLNDFDGELRIPDGYYFVLGDNRSVSKDSRMDEIGLIPKKDIVGKALFCVWPKDSIGDLYRFEDN